jgi:hypothetical protein
MKTKNLGSSEYLVTGLSSRWIVARRFDAWLLFTVPEGSEDTNDGEYSTCFETKRDALAWLETTAQEVMPRPTIHYSTH